MSKKVRPTVSHKSKCTRLPLRRAAPGSPDLGMSPKPLQRPVRVQMHAVACCSCRLYTRNRHLATLRTRPSQRRGRPTTYLQDRYHLYFRSRGLRGTYEVYSIYAKHIPNMGYPYAPYTGHSHAKDTECSSLTLLVVPAAVVATDLSPLLPR